MYTCTVAIYLEEVSKVCASFVCFCTLKPRQLFGIVPGKMLIMYWIKRKDNSRKPFEATKFKVKFDVL